MKFGQSENQKGYAMLITALILGAIAASFSISLLAMSLNSSKSTFLLERSALAKGYADACAEQALMRIAQSNSFSGGANLSFGRGNCLYEVIHTGAKEREVNASGIVESITRRVQVQVSKINPEVTVDAWKEVSDF
ncbi:MAG: hypothetical protein HYV77_03940 [Candidatus Wildermuthbacteria bacterium]|nr:hypothetical protein [Candidatus Wildermuthbacteria bacterium]